MPSDEINFTNGPSMQPGGAALVADAGYRLAKFLTDTPFPDPNNPPAMLRDVAVEIEVSDLATQAGVQLESYTYAADSGAANAYAVTLSPVPGSLAAGLGVAFKAANANTGASTLNVNSLGAITLKKWSSGALADLASGDISAGQVIYAKYDGTYFQILGGLSGGGGSGSVTSVGLSMPAEFSVSGSPVTGSGTIAVTKANENANLVYAGPSSGGAAAPTFRSLVEADLPSQPYDVAFSPNVVLGSGTIYDVWVAPRSVTFSGNFAGSVGHCRINPGSTQTIAINKNGTQVGTISISSSGVFTFSSTGGTAVTYNSGDYMTLTNQAGADASMLMQCTFAGVR